MSVVNPIPKPIDLNTRRKAAFPEHFFQFPGIFCKPSFSQIGTVASQGWTPRQREQDVMQMNEVRCRASEWVQRGTVKVAP
jgi:hypothetical protein